MTYRAPRSAAAAPTSIVANQYRVKQDDTLWSMANRMRPDNSVSVEQMMLALVRKNPEAFIKENINGVKRGYILRMPDRNELSQLDRQQAVAQAKKHAALWREYSQNSMGQAPASSMEGQAPSAGTSAVEEDTAGHLSIVGASKADGSEHAGANQDPDSELGRLKQELAMAREQLESERVEKEGLRTRLSDLEQKVQSVIQMDDGELAKLQQELQQQSQMTEQPVIEEVVEEVVAEPAEADVVAEEMVTEEVAVEAAAEDAEAVVQEDAADAVFVDELEVSADSEMTEAPDVADETPAIEPPAFAQPKPKGFFDSLMNDPKSLGMIGGGLAFVLLLIVLLFKRLRGGKEESQDDFATENGFSDAADSTMQFDALDTSDADDLSMVDTQIDVPAMDEDTVLNLNDDEHAAVDDQQDDVLAEADVYIAYGIYQQAEDLLKNAIDKDPERDDYRMKLLETYFAAKDATAFEQTAAQAQTRKGNDESYWGRVAAMGSELCPGSEMFFDTGEVISGFDADALVPEKPETTDVELDVDEANLGLDLGATAEVDALTDDLELDGVPDLGEDMSVESSEADEFDLSGDLTDIADEIEEPPADDEVAESLEFELGELTQEIPVNKVEVEVVSAEDEMDDLDIDEDFSLDFAASDLGFEEPEEESTLETVVDETDDLDLSADLDLGSNIDEPVLPDAEESLVDDESMEMDFTDDLGDSLSDDLGEIHLDDSELDLGDDLSLDESTDAAELETNAPSVSVSDDEEFDISELSEDLDEVSTKLDLAKAYIDMGDHEGARSILEEVKAEGNDEQQKEAESLLQQAG